MKRAKALHDATSAMESGNFLGWISRHPLALGLRFLVKIVAILGKATLRHLLGRAIITEDGDDSWTRSTAHEMKQLAEEIESGVADSRVLIGLRAAIDRQFHAPDYLMNDPFARMELRGFNYRTETPDGDDFEEDAICTLLVHASGICILTISLVLPPDLTLANARQYTYGAARQYSSLRISRTVVKHATRALRARVEDAIGEWSDEIIAGDHWLTIQKKNLSVEDVATLYMAAISSLVGSERGIPDWICYNSLAIDALGCRCRSQHEWMRRHKRELASVVGRLTDPEDISPEYAEELLTKDWSSSARRSNFTTEASAVFVSWNFTPDDDAMDVTYHFWRLVLIEHALLQAWQARRLGQLAMTTKPRERHLLRLNLMLSRGLPEFQGTTVAYGSARNEVEFLLGGHKVSETMERAKERIEYLGKCLDAYRVRSAARRDILLTGAGSAAAIVLGLPAIQESLRLLQEADALGLKSATDSQISSLALQLYIVLIAVVVAATLSVAVTSALRTSLRVRRRDRRQFGRDWRGQSFTVHLSTDQMGNPVPDDE